jgi:hypothetical protein
MPMSFLDNKVTIVENNCSAEIRNSSSLTKILFDYNWISTIEAEAFAGMFLLRRLSVHCIENTQ